MNRKQIICLWIGICGIVLLLILPPWTQTITNQRTGDQYIDRRWIHGHRFFFDPPEFERAEDSRATGIVVVDWSRLGIEVLTVILITIALIYTLKTKKMQNGQ